MSGNHRTVGHPFQEEAYEAVAAALPFAVDPGKVTAEPGVVSYLPVTIRLQLRSRRHGRGWFGP